MQLQQWLKAVKLLKLLTLHLLCCVGKGAAFPTPLEQKGMGLYVRNGLDILKRTLRPPPAKAIRTHGALTCVQAGLGELAKMCGCSSGTQVPHQAL